VTARVTVEVGPPAADSLQDEDRDQLLQAVRDAAAPLLDEAVEAEVVPSAEEPGPQPELVVRLDGVRARSPRRLPHAFAETSTVGEQMATTVAMALAHARGLRWSTEGDPDVIELVLAPGDWAALAREVADPAIDRPLFLGDERDAFYELSGLRIPPFVLAESPSLHSGTMAIAVGGARIGPLLGAGVWTVGQSLQRVLRWLGRPLASNPAAVDLQDEWREMFPGTAAIVDADWRRHWIDDVLAAMTGRNAPIRDLNLIFTELMTLDPLTPTDRVADELVRRWRRVQPEVPRPVVLGPDALALVDRLPAGDAADELVLHVMTLAPAWAEQVPIAVPDEHLLAVADLMSVELPELSIYAMSELDDLFTGPLLGAPA